MQVEAIDFRHVALGTPNIENETKLQEQIVFLTLENTKLTQKIETLEDKIADLHKDPFKARYEKVHKMLWEERETEFKEVQNNIKLQNKVDKLQEQLRRQTAKLQQKNKKTHLPNSEQDAKEDVESFLQSKTRFNQAIMETIRKELKLKNIMHLAILRDDDITQCVALFEWQQEKVMEARDAAIIAVREQMGLSARAV